MKSTASLLLMLTLASLVGCATTSGNFCDIAEAYRPQPGEVYSDQNKRKIVAANEYGEEHCGWKP